jgi:transcriptional regulator with XRE-family HTH domain
MMKEEAKISDVMKAYMDLYSLTQEKFATALNESLVNTDVSRVAVTNWCNSKSSPSTDFLLICSVVYQDWRRIWAVNCLMVKLPEVFESGLVEFKFKPPLTT